MQQTAATALKLGAFVSATRTDEDTSCRGVFVQENEDETIMVQTESGLYKCKPNPSEIPDESIRDQATLDFIAAVRAGKYKK